MSANLRVGALFAGMGGLELAVQAVFPGAHPAWVSEFDAAPSRILAQRFPGVPNLGDVTKVDWAAVEPVDIITGGSPCQDLSHAGKRAGMRSGTRSGLWASMCDAIEIIRPRLVVWENVRGALSAPADSGDLESCEFCMDGDGEPSLRALGRVLGDLAELGYDAAWTSLRAADVGAPHGRFRVFVLAWPAADADDLGGERPRDTRPGGADLRTAVADLVPHADGAARRERGFSAPGEAEGGRSRPDAGRRGGAPATGVTLLPTPAVNDMGAGKEFDAWDAWTDRMKAAHGNGNGHGRSLDVEARRLHVEGAGHLLPTPQAMDTAGAMSDRRSTSGYGPALRDVATLLPTPTSTDHKASGASYAATDTHHTGTTLTDATVRQPNRFGIYAAAIARWEAILGRPAPAPTEPTGKGGAHRLSPRFVEFLMGLPDGWVTDTDTTRNEQLKALGNGVVPQQAAAALLHLLEIRAHALTM